MKRAAKEVLRAARELPETERVELVEELLAEPDASDEKVDAAWAAEIDRRTRETRERSSRFPGLRSGDGSPGRPVKAAKLVFHPDAADEYVDALRWYGERSAAVHHSFVAEVE